MLVRMKGNTMTKPKYKIIEIITTLYVVQIDGSNRREEVRRSITTGRWFSTFNGLTREFKTEEPAMNYALIGK